MEVTCSWTVGVRFSAFRVRVALVLFRVISETLTLLTVTLQVAFTPLPSFALQVTVTVPFFRPVTLPAASTSAMAGSLLVQETVLSIASAGSTVAFSFTVGVSLSAVRVRVDSVLFRVIFFTRALNIPPL